MIFSFLLFWDYIIFPLLSNDHVTSFLKCWWFCKMSEPHKVRESPYRVLFVFTVSLQHNLFVCLNAFKLLNWMSKEWRVMLTFFIYICVCVRACACFMCLVTQSYPTLCNPMNCSPLGSSVYGDIYIPYTHTHTHTHTHTQTYKLLFLKKIRLSYFSMHLKVEELYIYGEKSGYLAIWKEKKWIIYEIG